ncbi:sorting nexin-16-like [Anneissia japonica]|uniref:sorting nexin-16-like n=1 Tax=Anneissia japonica TaxID=1529436 RepID=UPI0014254C03|nr:sorting nexin-16-like [Anneissia japonica]
MESVIDTIAGSMESHLVPRSISPASLLDVDLDGDSISEDFYSEHSLRNSLINDETDASSLAHANNRVQRERSNSCGSQTDVSSLSMEDLYVPIVGYEVMEQRARFTVFKIHVRKSPTENWFVFRRYTDFVRLNNKLKRLFPSFRLALPPKRWFGDNYDPNFLEDRQLGLQAFINNITSHVGFCYSKFTREFFCLDDQPGAHDSLEESRALCDSLEETIYNLRHDLAEKEAEVLQLKKQLRESQTKVDNLSTQLLNGGMHPEASRSSSQISEESLVEGDCRSCVEADQSSLGQGSIDHTSSEQSSPDHPSLTMNEPVECAREIDSQNLPEPNSDPTSDPTSDPKTTHVDDEKSENPVGPTCTDQSGPPSPAVESEGSWDTVPEYNNKGCQTKPNEIPVYRSHISSVHKQFGNGITSIEHNKQPDECSVPSKAMIVT